MSCTSPKTVASTIVPLVTPSVRSRNCSRCATAFFITSADCSTNGRISSPRAELVADVLHRRQQNVVEHVDRIAQRCSASSIFASMPSLRRRRIALWMRSSTGSPASSSALAGGRAVAPPSASQCSMTRCSASGRRLNTRSSHSSRSRGVDLGVRRDLLGVDDRHVEPGLDAVMQEDRVQRRARRRLEPERDVGNAERRQHAGQLALDQPDALDRLDRRRRETRRRRSPA